MYGGAVEAVVNISRSTQTLKAEHNAFRRYLLRAMALGAVRAYFTRGENEGTKATADLTALSVPNHQSRNEVEDEISLGNCWTR